MFGRPKAHRYTIVTPPALDKLVVSLNEAKTWLKIDSSDCANDVEITSLIKAAQKAFEAYTKLTLLKTKFKTERDYFGQDWELRRGPIIDITRFEYKKTGTLTAVNSSTYFLHKNAEYGFGYIALKDGNLWPSGADAQKDSIEIEFNAGFGDTADDFPDDIKIGLLNVVAHYYSNRGDCGGGDCATNDAYYLGIPMHAAAFFQRYRVLDLGGL